MFGFILMIRVKFCVLEKTSTNSKILEILSFIFYAAKIILITSKIVMITFNDFFLYT